VLFEYMIIMLFECYLNIPHMLFEYISVEKLEILKIPSGMFRQTAPPPLVLVS